MKKIMILFITILTSHTFAFAGNNWIFKVGFNRSALRGRDANTYNALSWGVERDIQLSPLFSIGTELYYSKNKVSFDNAELWNEAKIINSDIEISNGSLDLGVVMILNAFNKNNFQTTLRFIPSACLGYSHSINYQKDFIRQDSDWQKYEFVILEGQSDFYPNFSLKMSFSANFSYKYLYFEFRYTYNFQPIGEAFPLRSLNYRFNSIHFLFGIKI